MKDICLEKLKKKNCFKGRTQGVAFVKFTGSLRVLPYSVTPCDRAGNKRAGGISKEISDDAVAPNYYCSKSCISVGLFSPFQFSLTLTSCSNQQPSSQTRSPRWQEKESAKVFPQLGSFKAPLLWIVTM